MNFKLIFNDGNSYTFQQAVDNGYIEPLVMYISFYGSATCDYGSVVKEESFSNRET